MFPEITKIKIRLQFVAAVGRAKVVSFFGPPCTWVKFSLISKALPVVRVLFGGVT